MKKLFNGKFLFILASSIVVLILLALGAFYLFDDEDDVFVKSGYVLNPLSSVSEKYFFDENTGYKENLSSMIEFVDVDKNTVNVLKDSFLHYSDESLSFLKRGALLDLDTLDNKGAVSFYNINNDSIIEKRDSGYFIESSVGDVRLVNFMGRISDNKYIVVGDLSLKMAGNSTNVEGDYFEIVYIEEGVVNIENKNVKYQVTADETLIYVGRDMVIDLGDKKITVKGEDLMSITSITIDGNENIEIVPKGNDEDDEQTGGEGTEEEPTVPDEGQGGTGEGGEGSGGTGNENIENEETEELIVSLKDAKIGSTDIDVVFDVLNAGAEDILKLQVVNLSSGRTVDMVASVTADSLIRVNLLTPNTKYLFTVINEKDNGKYFQKVLETTGFGIKLEKAYATDNSLAYKITVEEGTDITNAKLSLYKFNEETKQNEIVKTSFVDSVTGEVVYEEQVTNLSSLTSLVGEHEIVYDNLDSDTIYTAVLDEFSLASVNFKDVYNITLTSMTLKKLPSFTEMSVEKNVGTGSFDLSLGNIVDPDNAIVKYTYVIYDKLTDEMAIEPIVQTNASPLNVKIGDGENQLKNDTNYYYRVIIEYFDNEKYIEYITDGSITFMMGNDPYVTVVPNDKAVTHDTIAATIYLTDNSCLVSMPGREKCNGNSTTVVDVSSINPLTGAKTLIHTELATFDVTLEEIKYELLVSNLVPGTTYAVDVRANLNNSDSIEKQQILHTEESVMNITTKLLSSFELDWMNYQSSANHVVNATVQFKADENSGTLSPEESIATIDKVVINLFEGRKSNNMTSPIAGVTLNKSEGYDFKSLLYDDVYPITSDGTFGLNLEALKNKSTDGKLNEYYTIFVEAYTETGYQITLNREAYSYKVSSLLLMDDLSEPIITVTGVTNKASGNLFPNLTNSGTYVGYSVEASFDRIQLIENNIVPKKINFYVYDTVGEKKDKIQFYVLDENGELVLTDKISANLGESSSYETTIFMDYGTSYETVDDIMRRGNVFYIGYEIEAQSGNEKLLYPVLEGADAPSDYGVYKKTTAEKESPSVQMYVASSDANSITYSYKLIDADKALYKEPESASVSLYATIGSGEPVKYPLTKLDGTEYDHYEGKVTINGLKNGSKYSIYYLKNNTKTGDYAADILQYLHGAGVGERTFDGYYQATDYKFDYQIINNQTIDNKVTIKILAADDLLDRIVSYNISFTDKKGNTLTKNLWKLESCGGSSATSAPRCLSIDYTELKDKGMKSEGNEKNWISVKVEALYDNGLIGYDFVVGASEEADYPYCILQGNSSAEGMGAYLSFNSSSTSIVPWHNEVGAQKGYYTYNLSGTMLRLKAQFGSKKELPLVLTLNGAGYYSASNSMNVTPKMISADEMICANGSEDGECNAFYFNSITPTVDVKSKSALLNGNVLNFELNGLASINDIKKENNKYYIYVETWENKEDVGDHSKIVRPAVKVEIDTEPNGKIVSGVIDGLKNETTYYHNVYAYMNKNGSYVYTQLFDDAAKDKSGGYVVKTYDFKTERVGNVFRTMTVSHVTSEKIYGNRSLKTLFTFKVYENYIPFNFDVVYVLCEFGAEDCGLGIGETHIFKKNISNDIVSGSFNDEIDISEYNLEYNKNYTMYIYAVIDYYNTPNEDGLIKRYVKLNPFDNKVTFNQLSEPSFTVTREAGVSNDGKYYIDLNVVVSDPDKTLVDGQYFIKLLNENGELAGTMQLKENGVFTDKPNYQEHAFDAFVLKKDIRITGLKPDSKYTFVVYNDAFMNNYCKVDSSSNSDECVFIPIEERTYEIRKSYTIYTTGTSGVAFGKNITYSATQKSIVLTFLGGSNFDNVVEVHYTAGMWGSEEPETYSGDYIIGQGGKKFEYNKDSDDWTFVITPNGMLNEVGAKYSVKVDFKIKDSTAEGGYSWFSSQGEAVYQK